ncbi:MAG: S41 family peptidase [Myxococcales bacterium]|nr:S41 family peptidase [Myxococcales bacterium]
MRAEGLAIGRQHTAPETGASQKASRRRGSLDAPSSLGPPGRRLVLPRLARALARHPEARPRRQGQRAAPRHHGAPREGARAGREPLRRSGRPRPPARRRDQGARLGARSALGVLHAEGVRGLPRRDQRHVRRRGPRGRRPWRVPHDHRPHRGGPAEKAGLKPGDEIVAIDGDDAKGISVEKSVRRMRGKPGTKVELTIRRPSDGKVYKVPLVRAEIHVPSVRGHVLPGNIVYLRLVQFQETTHAELLETVTKLKAKIGGKIAGVVLDLRRNPGGLVKQAVLVADEFLDKGVIFSMKGQGGKTLEEAKASAGGALVEPKLAVLVDDGSASAAELLAGALQDHKRATIVGTTTYGKGSVQSLIELPGGGGLKLTTARYYTPNGRAIQAQGVEPDLVVEATRALDDKPLPFLKEKDLPNALPPEAGKPLPNAAGTLDTKPKVTPPAVAHEPNLEKDFPLRMAHQVVSAKVKGAPVP